MLWGDYPRCDVLFIYLFFSPVDGSLEVCHLLSGCLQKLLGPITLIQRRTSNLNHVACSVSRPINNGYENDLCKGCANWRGFAKEATISNCLHLLVFNEDLHEKKMQLNPRSFSCSRCCEVRFSSAASKNLLQHWTKKPFVSL